MKYELTNTTINHLGRTLYQIKALKDFSDVSKGALGGYIESVDNLNQNDDAWVYDNAMVYGNARVYDNAWVYDNAEVYGNASVYGNARVYDNAWVYDNAEVWGNARVFGDARVFGNASVYGNARVYGNAWVYGNVILRDYDEIDNTYQFMYIQGFQYNITVTYSSIHIGCKDYYIGELDSIENDPEYNNNTDIPLIKAMIDLALEKILKDIK